ncbi:MAG: chorismate synthase [Bacilli bacterium]|nr:chorismate synthase [Bacilli bacterium]
MKNSIGETVIFTLFGESHQEYIGGVLDGLTPGIKVDEEFIKTQLAKRRPSSAMDTARVEEDDFQIISGVFNGYTTGSPIAVIIRNNNTHSGDYNKDLVRPSHADYVANVRYNGYQDYRGGGHFSGRITAPIVALGAIAIKALEDKGIKIGTHIYKCGKVIDDEFSNFEKDIDSLNQKKAPLLSNKEAELEQEILAAKEDKDSIGGVIQTAIIGLPVGLGEPWFSSLEGVIANAMFSIGGVKGIEFGEGFNFANGRGSDFNDGFRYENGEVKITSNHNGGINGGLSNGNPVVFNLAVKPTPSIAKKQESIDMSKKENVDLEIKGRHDPAIIRRICVVVNSLLAIVLADELEKRYGVDYFTK